MALQQNKAGEIRILVILLLGHLPDSIGFVLFFTGAVDFERDHLGHLPNVCVEQDLVPTTSGTPSISCVWIVNSSNRLSDNSPVFNFLFPCLPSCLGIDQQSPFSIALKRNNFRRWHQFGIKCDLFLRHRHQADLFSIPEYLL